MRIIVASDSYKESLSALEACRAIEQGIRDVLSDAEVILCPMADGGEGTVDALVDATGGEIHQTEVRGPLRERVVARWGMLGAQAPDVASAVIEMAAASGLPLVPHDRRDPRLTTTYGTGELVAAALDRGARRIILGIGGSATTDGGIGCAQAVGVRFTDGDGRALPIGASGGMLRGIHAIDVSGRDPRLDDCEVQVACDVDNPLCGPRGAAAVYSPQKGATPEMVRQLDEGLAHLADVIRRDLGRDVRDLPGAGASGGLGAGLVAFLGATLRPGIEIVTEALRLSERMAGADWVVTGEGRLDAQSMMGKVVQGVGRAAKANSVPVIAICGSIGPGAEESLQLLQAYFSIVDGPIRLDDAIRRAAPLLRRTAANIFRVIAVPRR